ncbi:MAG: DEAD/DEAH box helicase [Roseinatronobacter sp.]
MIPALQTALAEKGYETLTPVQEAVTNPDLADRDLLVSAQTGSGKTVGFGLAIGRTLLGDAESFDAPSAPLALIVAPTRELALQVKRELAWLYGKTGVQMASCVGGMDMRDERRALERGAHIVVGTPGRLRDHIQRESLNLSQIRAIVLDEADEMLDMGFREDLEFMLAEAPEDRRTLMFSATVPPMIATLAKHYQRDAVRVTTLTGARQHTDIAYQAIQVTEADIEPAILNLLRFNQDRNSIVFANTRATVNRLMARLGNRGFSVVSLSGELSQTERTHALQAMRDGRAQVCVATDVAARGIDLPGLDLVIHADLPMNAEALLHRSGRTGRAGRKGVSVLIVCSRQVNKAERLLKFAKISAEWVAAPTPDDVRRRDEERLMADPAWSDAPTESEAAFAARLAADHTPEALAVACLRLFNARLSAPEDLGNPSPAKVRPSRLTDTERPERPERAERAPFGPSAWVALSVGRDAGAEPRWILPMLIRAGGLQKEQIGAIRMQQDETFVQITSDAMPDFLDAIDDTGMLEGEIAVRTVDGEPEFAPRPERAPRPDRAPRDDRPARAERPSRSHDDRPRPPRDDARPARAPRRFDDRPSDAPRGPRKFDGPRSDAVPRGPRKFDGPRPDARPARDDAAPRPARKFDKPRDDAAPRKPYGKPEGAPKRAAAKFDAPKGAVSERPARPPRPRFDDAAPASRKSYDKPKPEATPLREGAADPSKRFARPGKPLPKPAGKFGSKPGAKPFTPRGPRAGGDTPPRKPFGKGRP